MLHIVRKGTVLSYARITQIVWSLL